MKPSPILLFSKKYSFPERYRLVPEGKLLEPFGISIADGISFRLGEFYGRKNQLLYDLYSPIDATVDLDTGRGILTLRETDLGFSIKVYGMKETAFESNIIHRGAYLGRAFQIHASKPGVYVECIISSERFKELLEGRYMTSEDILEPHLAERRYIRDLSIQKGCQYLSLKTQVTKAKKRNRVYEVNPYWIVQRPVPYHSKVTYFSYSSMFC